MHISKTYLLMIVFCLNCFNKVYSQCTPTISTFPYNEGFENSDGGWVADGTLSDWAWGTPYKSRIISAGNKSKCWITGGLTNSFYNYGEASYLQSPVFDISSLENPFISFKVMWETEQKYDGSSLQYSTDCGNTWNTLGNINDVVNCPNSNWFNTSSSFLANGVGWSGNVDDFTFGFGSWDWVTAFHTLSNVKGATSIMFRFTFNANAKHPNYDGFAVDDIFIGEAPPPENIDFAYICMGNNAVDFITASSGVCTFDNDFSWNFGDPNSPFNTDNHQEIEHIFSAPGTYHVTLTANGISVTKTITVFNIAVDTTSVSCNGGSNGTATAVASGSNNTYNYSWSTNPAQTTATANNLFAGNYTVTVTSTDDACPVSVPVTITQPQPLTADIAVTKPICGNNKGSATVTVQGGTSPYNYLWNTNATTASINNLSAGNYSLKITDNNSCTNNFNITIPDSTVSTNIFLGNDTTICNGEQLVLSAGNHSSYLWQDGSSNATYSVTTTGNYWVKATDANGCTATSNTIKVTVGCVSIYFPSAFTPNGDGLNDDFGPWGSLNLIKNYSFTIYGRWGGIVFHSTNPYEKWDGKMNGKDFNTGSFVWLATYSFNGGTIQTKKGIVTIIH